MYKSSSPLAMAFLSCSVRMSFTIRFIRPPLYRNDAKPSAKILIAEEEKNPNIKSNLVALHKQSEKKPIGSHSVRDLKWRCAGNITSFSIAINLYQCWMEIRSSNSIQMNIRTYIFTPMMS